MRILRLLTERQQPQSAGAIAAAVSLNDSGVRRTLDRLVRLDLIETFGSQYLLREAHPLAEALRRLFDAERSRFDAIIKGVRASTRNRSNVVDAAWIEGSVATGDDSHGEAIRLAVLASARLVDAAAENVRHDLLPIERRMGVRFEVRGVTHADIAAATADEIRAIEASIPICGRLPVPAPARKQIERISSHADMDRWARALADAIAEKVERGDASVVTAAERFIEQRMEWASDRERKELESWRDILQTHTPPLLAKLLREDSERATRLRQSLPFVDALTDSEVRALREAE